MKAKNNKILLLMLILTTCLSCKKNEIIVSDIGTDKILSSEIIKKYNLKLASSSPNIKADITKEFNTSSELISYLDRTDQLLSSENARFASVDYFDKSCTIKIIDGRYDLSGNRGSPIITQ